MTKLDKLLAERGEVHGPMAVQFKLAQTLKQDTYSLKINPIAREALDMICTKLSRIVAGNPHHEDHWRDLAGYATLVADQLSQNKKDKDNDGGTK